MVGESMIWHYGLMAERWSEVINEVPEKEFLLQKIHQFGQPVLDVACGTGRLLLPLAREGIQIGGLDYSADMLAFCHAKAEEEKLEISLYQRSMADFDLPQRYRLIYIIGSFGLAGSRAEDLETLRCCYRGLKNGGALVLNIQAEYSRLESWARWATDQAGELPEPWPEKSRDKQAADGTIHRAYFRVLALDPLEQRYTRQVRLEKWVQDEMIAQEEYSLSGNMYLKNELELMLELVGFSKIDIFGDYTNQPAGAAHDELIFTAVKSV